MKKLNSLLSLRGLWARLCWLARGLAHDFWKDGSGGFRLKREQPQTSGPAPVAPRFAKKTAPVDDLWHALPGEISEKMWGQNCVTPADEYLTELLLQPLALNKDNSVLDISAGLGWRLRHAVHAFGCYIDGLEPDPEIAKRGMQLSVAAGMGKKAPIAVYDPMNLSMSRTFDAIISRETIYRVADKEKFIKSIVACAKPRAQISFTDYVVNSEVRDAPAIVAWRAFEVGVDPAGLVEMAELWAKAGLSLRVHDDQTDYYKKEVMAGMARFAKFMASGVKPDADTKKAINKRITVWAHRMAAIEAGMKFYRFYGVR